MSKSTSHQKQKLASTLQPATILPPAMSWAQLSDQEEALLLESEAFVLQHFDKAQSEAQAEAQTEANPKSPVASVASWPFAWGWQWAACGAVVLLAILGWRLWPGQVSSLPSLRIEGNLELQQLSQTTHRDQDLRLIFAPKGQIADPQGWSLEADTRTHLRLQRRGPKSALLQLQQGAVTVHVTPRAMKQFAISCKGDIQVVVKGTVFAVWQSPSSIRVEVFRGRVLLQRKGQSLLSLGKGQGVRIEEAQGRWQTYQIGPKPLPWLDKIEWMARHQPTHLFSYAQDIGDDAAIPKTLRLQALELASYALTGAKRWHQAYRLWMRLVQMQPQGIGTQTALFQAAQSCRQSRASRPVCLRLYRQFYQRFPQAMASLREISLAWWSRLLSQQPDNISQAKARQLFQRYLQAHPQGVQARTIRRLLQRYP